MKFTCINNILVLMWNKDSFKRKPISKHNTNITKVDFECEIIFVLKIVISSKNQVLGSGSKIYYPVFLTACLVPSTEN